MDSNKKHINAENWQRFFNHRMTENEKSSFLEEIEQDDFAREAMEGFSHIGDADRSRFLIQKIQKKVLETKIKTKRKKTVAIFPLVYKVGAIAASFALLIGSVFFISNNLITNNESSLAEASMEEKDVVTETISIKTAESESESDFMPSDEGGAIGGIPDDGTIFFEEEEMNEKIDLGKDDAVDLLLPSKDIELVNEEVESADAPGRNDDKILVEEIEEEAVLGNVTTNPSSISFDDAEEDLAYKKESNSAISPNQSQVAVTNNSVDFYQIGLVTYQSGDYSNAEQYFDKSIKNGFKTIESNYYAGLCNYYLGNQNNAISNFDDVIASDTNFSSSARWYKADLLVKKGKIKQAKSLYQELVEGNSTFKEQAQEMLEKL